ncbi:uncharacterized protein TRIVIDRAFT_222594 [Trichoderma virens Gv29-8]|uniref:Transcription factor domain-containing protein n=1 Tax=Hypocrea virens (strain Gv29-8 / FGSC 10586) TaxID=413071 RepID=G9MUC9_HYPVG|nr:uncharacterized protein TRIVIDRAFT_222594 [Trichoderma virens Gv29-8]EHK21942.1 hypothetical protein TRIVIDRAFT_222594 [Trichoderma virens Gv29-8]
MKRESGRRAKAAKCSAKSPAPTSILEDIEIPDDDPVRPVEERPSPSPPTGKGSSLTTVTSGVESPAIQFPEMPEYLEETVFLDDGPNDFLTQLDLDHPLLGMANEQGQFLSNPWLDVVCNNEYYLVGIFVDFITSPRRRQRSWVFELPNIMASTTLPSVKFSIRAAALIYYAVSNRDNATAVDALHWYLAALESYRMSLHGSSHKPLWDAKVLGNSPNASSSPPSLDQSGHCSTICVPMMFTYFEQMQGVTPDAGLKHLNVACDMLEAIGPHTCSFGLQHRIFRSVRSLEAFQAILRNKSARFATTDWCQIPFAQDPKGSWDRIVDVAFSFLRQVKLPNVDEPASNIRDGVRAIQDLPRKQKLEIEVAANGVMSQLVDWWKEYVGEDITVSPVTKHFSFEDTSILAESLSLTVSQDSFIYGDTHTAGAIALFNAISIIIQHILLLITLSKPPQPNLHEPSSAVLALQSSIHVQASSILHLARCIRETNSYCGDASRVIFAVKVVSLLALEDDQRDQAQVIANDQPGLSLLSGTAIEMVTRWSHRTM